MSMCIFLSTKRHLIILFSTLAATFETAVSESVPQADHPLLVGAVVD